MILYQGQLDTRFGDGYGHGDGYGSESDNGMEIINHE